MTMDYAQMGMMLSQLIASQSQNKNKNGTGLGINTSAITRDPGVQALASAAGGGPQPNGMGEIINWKDQVGAMPKAAGMGTKPVNPLVGLGGDEGVDMGYTVAERGGTPWEAFNQEGFGSGMSAMGDSASGMMSNPGFGSAMGSAMGMIANSGGDKEAKMLGSSPTPTGGSALMLDGADSSRMAAAQQMMAQLLGSRRGSMGPRGLTLNSRGY